MEELLGSNGVELLRVDDDFGSNGVELLKVEDEYGSNEVELGVVRRLTTKPH